MSIHVQLTNGQEAKAFLKKLNAAINDGLPSLFRSLGDVYVADVKHRIISQDDGKWAPASKWLRAKKATSRVLDGAERYVRARISKNKLSIVSTARGWTLTQHHDGFTNALVSPKDKFDEFGRVVIPVKDPRPLNLYAEMRKARDGSVKPRSTTFHFKAVKPGKTPARKIWPTADEAIRLGSPIASRWLTKIVRDVGGTLIHE